MKSDAFGSSKHGEGKLLSKFFLLHLSVHWGDLIEQIKKICHIYFKGELKRCFVEWFVVKCLGGEYLTNLFLSLQVTFVLEV